MSDFGHNRLFTWTKPCHGSQRVNSQQFRTLPGLARGCSWSYSNSNSTIIIHFYKTIMNWEGSSPLLVKKRVSSSDRSKRCALFLHHKWRIARIPVNIVVRRARVGIRLSIKVYIYYNSIFRLRRMTFTSGHGTLPPLVGENRCGEFPFNKEYTLMSARG